MRRPRLDGMGYLSSVALQQTKIIIVHRLNEVICF